LFIGTAGQGQFSDRFGRRFIYQFNLLLFGIFIVMLYVATERSSWLGLEPVNPRRGVIEGLWDARETNNLQWRYPTSSSSVCEPTGDTKQH
jgi:hypothetical protein